MNPAVYGPDFGLDFKNPPFEDFFARPGPFHPLRPIKDQQECRAQSTIQFNGTYQTNMLCRPIITSTQIPHEIQCELFTFGQTFGPFKTPNDQKVGPTTPTVNSSSSTI